MIDLKYKPLYSPSAQSPTSRLASGLMRRISKAAKKERWGKAFFQIAWTAGPVTYLGLQGGYYIAYGKMAPSVIFIYFAGYTLIAGLFALIARFVYNATRGDEESPDRKALEFVFDALPQRIVEIRNLQLKVLDLYGRKVMAAKYLLENPFAGSDTFATAVQDLLEDDDLAIMIRRMETYRGNALYIRAKELQDEISPLLSPHLNKLREVSGKKSQILKKDRKRGPGIHKVLASIPDIRSARIFQERIVESMNEMLSSQDKNSPRMRQCLTLYKRLHRQGKTALNAYRNFRKAWERRESLIHSSAPKGNLLLKNSGKGQGVLLVPSFTTLNRRQILPFASKIRRKLEEFDAQHENSTMQANDEKELAIDLLLIADDYLPLEEIPVQQAIEATASAYVSRSEKKSTGATANSWGLTLVEDDQYPERQVLHEVLDNLLTFEKLDLTDDDIEYLSDILGADEDFLKKKIENADPPVKFSLDEPNVIPSLDELMA